MSWTYEEIQRDWLAGNKIAVDPDDIVVAFDRCERVLGRDWIDTAHKGGVQGALGPVKGTAPTLRVVSMGMRLASLDDIANREPLIDKLRNWDASANAELSAISMLREGNKASVDLEPTIVETNRKCDFRIRLDGEPWVYVEVTRPDSSDAQARVEMILRSACDEVVSIKKPFALELFFRREPSDEEIGEVIAAALRFCCVEHATAATIQVEMPNRAGLLILNQQPVGQVVVHDHGEANVPRIGMARVVVGPGEPNRHVAIRMPYADQRAERFLTSEARQLPRQGPGLIMADMALAPGGFRSWEPAIKRRFQPTQHTRVGGVCMFSSGLVPTEGGEACLFETKLIPNEHANTALPAWICTTIEAAGREFQRLTEPARRAS
jgi:hypothetical protein